MLIDVSATTLGGSDGNAISYHAHGPIYIMCEKNASCEQ
jgi:hypothetical protein